MEYPEGHLIGEAREIADRAKSRGANVESELAELELRRAELQMQVAAARSAESKYASFVPKVGNEYQCPRCWIEEEARGNVWAIPGTATEDKFRCQRCHQEFVFRFR